MARSSMADLVTRLRLLIGDPVSASQTFEDDELQGFLDDRRVEVREAELRYQLTTVAGASVYRDYYAPRPWWEADAVLSGTTGASLTPTTSDPLAGHWTFTAGQLPPVYITGRFYDLYGAAVAVLQAWQAKVAREFDFVTDGQTFDRSQKRAGLAALAAEYRRYAVQPGQRPARRSAAW